MAITIRTQLSMELEEGRGAALMGISFKENPYRKPAALLGPLVPYRVYEMARNWESGWAAIPESDRGKLRRNT